MEIKIIKQKNPKKLEALLKPYLALDWELHSMVSHKLILVATIIRM